LRTPEFLSPSSKSKWLADRVGYYLKYLTDVKQPREPQAIFMGVGSGFDARVKSEILTRVMGKPLLSGSAYDFETLFEKQVEHHHRDRSLALSTEVYDSYVASGAMDALMKDIEKSPSAPMMEERLKGVVGKSTLLGLPDLVYIDAISGFKVICDWKILGSASAKGGGASPPQGFQIVRDGWSDGKPSKNNLGSHAKYTDRVIASQPNPFAAWDLPDYKCVVGDVGLEDFNMDWADQMSTYAWLLGSKVGAQDFIVRIECAACRHPKKIEGMRIKWSTHMNQVSPTHQLGLIKTYNKMTEQIASGHIFDDLTREENDERCEILEIQAAAPKNVHPALRGIGGQSTYFPRTK
jgi:hypothetical protein